MEQNGTDETTDDTGLTDKQLAALPYIVADPTLAEGTRLATIGRTTIYRWMGMDEHTDFAGVLARTGPAVM